MGNQVSLVPKVSYEDIQMIVYRNSHIPNSTLLINTLPPSLQHCLIKTTVDIRIEEQFMNKCLMNSPNVMIIIYGKNSNDITILHKYEQLVKLGFTNVHIYTGGIFEWMLLHEIYGKDLFKITRYEIDILRYRPKSVLLAAMTGGGGGGGGGGGYIEDNLSHRRTVVGDGDGDGDGDGGGDVRLDIHPEDNGTSGGGAGSILSTGIKWLFGV
jgi:hypothetical protein